MSAKLENEQTEEVKQITDTDELAARLVNSESRHQTITQALTSNWKRNAWLLYGVWMILCCSFDMNAGNTALGIPRFRQDFGYAHEGDYVLYADWQSAFSGGPAATQIVGTFIAGTLGDRFGRRYMALLCYFIVFIGTTCEIVANISVHPNAVFFIGKCLNGLGVGVLLTTGMAYISEIAPVAIRGIAIAAAAISWCVGTLILALVIYKHGELENDWAYKSIFCTQYAVTGVALLILPFMPESPAWCVGRGKDEQAVKSSRKLGLDEEGAQRNVAAIRYTIAQIQAETQGASYAQLFRKSNLRRTMVACMPLTIQPWTGVMWVAGYFLYYTQLAGYSTNMSYKLNIAQQVLSTTGNMASWFLIERVGRRGLSFWGLIILTTLLLLAGGMATYGTPSAITAVVGLILTYCFMYNATIGATGFVALSEIGSTKLRNKTAGMAIALKNVWETMWSFVLPFLFNPNAANLQARVSFIFGGISVLSCVYLFFCHPETKGRTFDELDELFVKRVPARKFATYVTEAEVRAREADEREATVAVA